MKLLNSNNSRIYFDQYLFIAITLISIMGLVFLYSASQGNLQTVIKQSLFVIFGLSIMFLLSQPDPDFYKNYLDRINAVTAEDVKRVAQKYFNVDQARVVVTGKGL